MSVTLLNSPPHPPTSRSPEHPASGEIARIRVDKATARAMQERLTEACRPDYMRRIARLGIAETPIKGRCIELWAFRETSEESFEEWAMR
ncbi:hypothetical protein BGY98DRAFT_955047 [Russula aff. rugulosa BPL654]|nr:hypothetical protein BGY98DRAFT_955047 [Russula aff. rugulosa BPL654]